MKNIVLKYYIAAFYLFSTVVSFAQPGDGDDSNGDPLEGIDNPAAPIDGYVYILAAIGLIYVFQRLRAFAQQRTDEQ